MAEAAVRERSPRIGVIGPGRAGTTVAAACVRAGWPVVAVAGGSDASRARFAASIAGVRTMEVAELPAGVDLVVVAVPDRAIAEVVDAMAVAGSLDERHRLVHLAGAHGCAPLRRAGLAGARIAACHPAMTMPATRIEPDVLVGAAWAVTVPSGADDRWAQQWVEGLGGQPFSVAESARVNYHAALTVGANAVGAAVATARQLLLAAGVNRPEAFLDPLVAASIGNVLRDGASALTGPVVRGDSDTVAAHLAALAADAPSLADAYRHLTWAILAQAKRMMTADDVARIETVLAADPAERGAT
ncbi:MAG: DUF2520 domain-containing protein [Nitriliruptoraceae bacterium]